MENGAILLLTIFYAGALCASGRAWLAVLSGRIGYSGLRDLTGIGDRVTLRRLFGLTLPDGSYQVRLTEVLRHRRRSGIILTDLPVHGLFLAALGLAAAGSAPAGAVALAASAHVLIVSGAAVSILIDSRRVVSG